MAITRIWVKSGCILCGWCNDLAPEVFGVGKTSSEIRGDARTDGVSDRNRKHVRLAVPITGQMAEFMEFVVAGCPTQVIKIAQDGPA